MWDNRGTDKCIITTILNAGIKGFLSGASGVGGVREMPISPPNWSSSALSVLCTGLSTNSVVLNLGCVLESPGELYKALMPGSHPSKFLLSFDLSVKIHKSSPDDSSISQS